MTLDPRHEENLRYVRERMAHYIRKVQFCDGAIPNAVAAGNLGMAKAYESNRAEYRTVLDELLRIEEHLSRKPDHEWLNIPLPKGSFMDAVHKRADQIAVDYGWQEEMPQYQMYVEQTAEVLNEAVTTLVERGLNEFSKQYMDDFCAEIFDEANFVSPEAIDDEGRRAMVRG